MIDNNNDFIMDSGTSCSSQLLLPLFTLPHILQSTPVSFSLQNASHALLRSHKDACQPISGQPAHSAAHQWLVGPLNPVSCSKFLIFLNLI